MWLFSLSLSLSAELFGLSPPETVYGRLSDGSVQLHYLPQRQPQSCYPYLGVVADHSVPYVLSHPLPHARVPSRIC